MDTHQTGLNIHLQPKITLLSITLISIIIQLQLPNSSKGDPNSIPQLIKQTHTGGISMIRNRQDRLTLLLTLTIWARCQIVSWREDMEPMGEKD